MLILCLGWVRVKYQIFKRIVHTQHSKHEDAEAAWGRTAGGAGGGQRRAVCPFDLDISVWRKLPRL